MIADNDPIREIATVVAVVANDNTLSVQLNESGRACIEWNAKRITLSDKAIPKCYRVHPLLTRYFRLALAMHEAQHWSFMKGMIDEYNRWINSRRHPELATMALNIVDDYRGNTWLEESYIDIGQRITWMNRAMLKAWKPQLGKMLRKAVKDGEKAFLENPVNFVVHGAIQCAILGVDVQAFSEEWAMWTGYFPPPEAIASIQKIVDASWESKYKSQETIFESYQEVYRILEMNSEKKWNKKSDGSVEVVPGPYRSGGQQRGGMPIIDMSKVPINFGGDAEVEGQKGEALKEAEKLKEKLPDSPGNEYQTHAGKGAGTECPTPEADEGVYRSLIMRNQPYIISLLNKLKTLMQPHLESQKYQKSGKLMTKHLAKWVTQRRPVENIYQRKKFTLEKQKVALSLVVDLSGSMDTQLARDVLTTIAEVGGQWLDDEDLAVFVFGSEYQKVKAFNEPYRSTRARIGGVNCLGGTMLAECLRNVHKMYRASVPDSKMKICVIVSDFAIGDAEETHKEMALMVKDGIRFIGVGMCASDINYAKRYTGPNSTYMETVTQLPSLFYEIYRRASTTGIRYT